MKPTPRFARRGRRLRLCMAVAAFLFAGTASGTVTERVMKMGKDYLRVPVSGRAERRMMTGADAKGQTCSFDIRLSESPEFWVWVNVCPFSRRKTTIFFLQKKFSLFQKDVSSDHPARTLDLTTQCSPLGDGNVSPEEAGRLLNEDSRNETLRLSKALRTILSRLPPLGKPALRNSFTASLNHAIRG